MHPSSQSIKVDRQDRHSLHPFRLLHSIQPSTTSPSDLPAQEYLNHTFASSICSGSRFTATIPPHDLQSFVTDHPQTWLTQPQSPRLPLPATSSSSSYLNQDSDFVLFPTTADTRPARRHTDLPATPCIAPSTHAAPAYSPPNGQRYRSNSTQQDRTSSASPIQNPRVSGIIHGTGSFSSSPSMQQFNPTGQSQHFYSNSAPSSSTGLIQNQSPRTRPPVPLFHNSTGNLPKQDTSSMALPIHSEGTFREVVQSPSPVLTNPSSEYSSADSMIDFNDFNDFGSAPDTFINESFDYSLAPAGSHFEAINHQTPGNASVDPQTISPKDLVADYTSAPPSGAFTDLTTPGTSTFESPYMANSNETSPLFIEDNFGEDPDQWPSLFEPQEEPISASTVKKSSVSPVQEPGATAAPKMSRNGSSPGQTSSRSSQQGRHSSASGVAPRRRDKPLPAITVEDPNDTVAVKRARNTLAARKSREKRVEKTESLISQVATLEKEVERWKEIALNHGYVE